MLMFANVFAILLYHLTKSISEPQLNASDNIRACYNPQRKACSSEQDDKWRFDDPEFLNDSIAREKLICDIYIQDSFKACAGCFSNQTMELCLESVNLLKNEANRLTEAPSNFTVEIRSDFFGMFATIKWDTKTMERNANFVLIQNKSTGKTNFLSAEIVPNNKFVLDDILDLCTQCSIRVAVFENRSIISPFSNAVNCIDFNITEVSMNPSVIKFSNIMSTEFSIMVKFDETWMQGLAAENFINFEIFMPLHGDLYWLLKTDKLKLQHGGPGHRVDIDIDPEEIDLNCSVLVHISNISDASQPCKVPIVINQLRMLTFNLNGRERSKTSCYNSVQSIIRRNRLIPGLRQTFALLDISGGTIKLYEDNEQTFDFLKNYVYNPLKKFVHHDPPVRVLKISLYKDDPISIKMGEISNSSNNSSEKNSISGLKATSFIYSILLVAITLLVLITILACHHFVVKLMLQKDVAVRTLSAPSISTISLELNLLRDRWEVSRACLLIERIKLGAGEFGTVYKANAISARCTKLNGDRLDVAVKTLHLNHEAEGLNRQNFIQEIELMKKIGHHDHLVNMLGCITTCDPLCLIMEFCPGGNLKQFLRQKRLYMIGKQSPDSNFISLQILLHFAWQVACGMEYLSQKKFVHRDLAARNILLDIEQNVKICDFGLCRYFPNEYYTCTTSGRLPIKWMALESIVEHKFASSSDVWSFGVVLFELMTLGGCPYPGIDPNGLENYLKSGSRMAQPEFCPNEMYRLMETTWSQDPSMRPTFDNIKISLSEMINNLEGTNYDYITLNTEHDYYNDIDTITKF